MAINRRSAPPPLEDLHTFVSFEDPDEERTWVFDTTFLTSSWTCLYGDGCPGIEAEPAPEEQLGCCSNGAHLSDDADRRLVEARAAQLTDAQWQHRAKARARGGPIKMTPGGDTVTRMVDGACIFLNRVGFDGPTGCALHHAANEAGESLVDWKPEVCWQLPLRRIDEEDEAGHVTSTVREWKRRDWGDGGAEFHWWCTESPEAFIAAEPVYVTLADELRELCGDIAYEMIADHLADATSAPPEPHHAVAVEAPRRR